MAESLSIRASRRVMARRSKIIENADDSSVDDATDTTKEALSDNEEFTPAPKRSPKRPSTTVKRRTTADDPDATPVPKTARSRKAKLTASASEASQIFDPEAAAKSPPTSPTKRGSPKKQLRSRRDRFSSSSSKIVLPTPESSVTPEPGPLSDITERANNGQPFVPPTPATELAKKRPLDLILEKPMDIVVRTRALGMPQEPESNIPKARMVIKYLNLVNFKSYAGRQEVGPFHASFSSVVGPNGSGKSNVIDALLFVFGFRASKMRQGKISALIHSSAAHPSLDFCEVEVVFEEIMDQPGGTHGVVPGSSLVVSRKAFKNNSSEYFINGDKSNFTTVTTLLREKGIDLDHKRFLILQGEVESIAQMKPKAQSEHDDGLLEYLEDIIGTSKYKTPIDEASVETEELNEVCKEKNNRVQIVEKEKKSLEEKKNKALAYVRDENELVLKQSALYQLYQAECEDNLQVTEEAVNNMQSQLDEELGKHKGSEDLIKTLEKNFKKEQKVFDAMEKDAHSILKEKTKFEKDKVRFDEKKKFLSNKQKKLERSLHTSQLAVSEAAGLSEKYQQDTERCTREIEELEEQMNTETQLLTSIRDSMKGKTQGFSDAIAEKQAFLEPWNEKISKQESKKAIVQNELDILKERASSGQKAIDEANARVTSLKDENQEKFAELRSTEQKKSELEKSSKQLQRELAALAEKEPESRNRLSGARQKADEARSNLQSSQSRGNVLNGLLRLKESGRIEGFHGRLGNLGTIDQKYDVAISTACSQLDNLVGDTVEVGQQCITYLRKNNLGRANIICLDRLPKRDMSSIPTPENAPRLFDLVKPKDETFRPAFFSVLQNTLVANDLAQANRIAYGARRWRVVTLDGQLIDVSGAMSGGGTRVARGAMSSKITSDVSKDDVAKLETNREELEEQCKELQERRCHLEEEIRIIVNRIPTLETQMQKLEMEISSTEKTLTDSQNRITELTSEQRVPDSDTAQMSKLQDTVVKIDSELEQLRKQTSGVENEIKELQDKIMEVGGVRLRMQKAKVDGIKEQINTLGEERSNAEVSRLKAQKDEAKHKRSVDNMQSDVASAVNELQQLESEGNELLKETSLARQRGDETQTALDNKKEEIEELKRDLLQHTMELNETRAAEIEMRNRLEENQKVFAENEKRLQYWNEKLSKLSLQSISDLENAEVSNTAELPSYTRDELLDMPKDTLKAEIAALEEKTSNNSVDVGVLEEYRRRVQEHSTRYNDLQTAVAARDAAKKRCDDLRRLRLEGFMQGFSTISLRLKEMYQMITMGGNAELELVDSLDPFSEGILFSVMPPKKSWKNISNLSGGEKTLSSLALVFALHHYKPTPLYVMDEIDAALDFRNVSIVASYIKERTKNAQFIVISLRNNMFELASRLVGVYKVNHMTKSVTVENRDYMVRRR